MTRAATQNDPARVLPARASAGAVAQPSRHQSLARGACSQESAALSSMRLAGALCLGAFLAGA